MPSLSTPKSRRKPFSSYLFGPFYALHEGFENCFKIMRVSLRRVGVGSVGGFVRLGKGSYMKPVVTVG
jgi:hypothetical protein